MLFSFSLQVLLGFVNVTSIAASIGKSVNNVGLRKFRDRVFRTEKTSNF